MKYFYQWEDEEIVDLGRSVQFRPDSDSNRIGPFKMNP